MGCNKNKNAIQNPIICRKPKGCRWEAEARASGMLFMIVISACSTAAAATGAAATAAAGVTTATATVCWWQENWFKEKFQYTCSLEGKSNVPWLLFLLSRFVHLQRFPGRTRIQLQKSRHKRVETWSFVFLNQQSIDVWMRLNNSSI